MRKDCTNVAGNKALMMKMVDAIVAEASVGVGVKGLGACILLQTVLSKKTRCVRLTMERVSNPMLL